MMTDFICPVCRKPLEKEQRRLVCPQGHSFDMARQGYVNLLRSQQPKEKRHGDDRMMARARRDFLNEGHYAPLLRAVVVRAEECVPPGGLVLDVGCGECYYTEGVARALAGRRTRVAAVDISKDALIVGAGRGGGMSLAVASAFDLPVADGAAALVLSLFAPTAEAEFLRVLAPGGILLRAVPLERHLFGLKKKIYDHPYENPPESGALLGFTFESRQEIRYRIKLSGQETISNLFRMTPYFYKTGVRDQQRASELTELSTEVEFGLLTYRKE